MKTNWVLAIALAPVLTWAPPSSAQLQPSQDAPTIASFAQPDTPTFKLTNGGVSYWDELPGNESVTRYYPDLAQRMNKGGSVRLKCTLTDEGRLNLCDVLSEAPKGYGFGDAGLALSKFFKMHPTTTDGRPVGGVMVIMPIEFKPPPLPPPKR